MTTKPEPTDDCETTPTHWDCECEKNYIHTALEDTCKICGKHRDEQPDSRVNEVTNLTKPEPTHTPGLVRLSDPSIEGGFKFITIYGGRPGTSKEHAVAICDKIATDRYIANAIRLAALAEAGVE